MRQTYLLLLFVVCTFCGCGPSNSRTIRIGIDESWNLAPLYGHEAALRGFIEDLLVEISKDSPFNLERVNANCDGFCDGLMHNQYEVALSSMAPYLFNQAKFDFSIPLLELGTVLVIAKDRDYESLADLSNKIIGVLKTDPAILLINSYPSILSRKYEVLANALNAVVDHEIEAVLLDRMLALSYVHDLYAGQLQIVDPPLNSRALRFIAAKDHSSDMQRLNESLKKLGRKKRLEALLRKWNLN